MKNTPHHPQAPKAQHLPALNLVRRHQVEIRSAWVAMVVGVANQWHGLDRSGRFGNAGVGLVASNQLLVDELGPVDVPIIGA